MSSQVADRLEIAPLPGVAGRFLPTFRNRPVGEERVVWAAAPDGGLQLSAVTDLSIDRFQLRQSVEAGFDCAGRPRSCIVTATSGQHRMSLEIQISDGRIEVRCMLDGDTQTRTMPIPDRPLLLVDNCFALHAFAAVVARGGAGPSPAFTSIPAGNDLTVTAPGRGSILMGGHDLGAPDITLHLAKEVEEHAWLRHGWVERLALPRAQMRIDWCPEALLQAHGGSR